MKDTKRAELMAHCANYVNEYLYTKIGKSDADFNQAIHDLAMALEAQVLIHAKESFFPKAMKDIEKDIKKWIEFHKFNDKQSQEIH